jgi:diguanylate cyclase (GGDEF)-like protein/PAS domain S-box-containing protein
MGSAFPLWRPGRGHHKLSGKVHLPSSAARRLSCSATTALPYPQAMPTAHAHDVPDPAAAATRWRDALFRAAAHALDAPLVGIQLAGGQSWVLLAEDRSVLVRQALVRSTFVPIASVLASGRALWLPDVGVRTGGAGESAPPSIGAVPLEDEGGGVLGCFWVATDREREWSAADRATMGAFARSLSLELGRSPLLSASMNRAERREAEHFRMLFEAAPLGIVIGDFPGQQYETNPAFREILWWWEGSPFEDAVRYTHPDDLDRDTRYFHEVITGAREHYQIEKRYVRPDGSILWADLTTALIRDKEGEPAWFCALVQDITERKRLEEALARRSVTDELTGLMNRRGFFSLAQREVQLARRRGEELLLLYIDIDRFKEINDTHGHAEGDRLLEAVASLIRACCRSTDIPARAEAGADVLARMGGDEFVILASDARQGAEMVLLNRIHTAVERFNAEGGRAYTLSLSVGLTRCAPARSEVSVDALLADADRDMYRQKRRAAKRDRPPK